MSSCKSELQTHVSATAQPAAGVGGVYFIAQTITLSCATVTNIFTPSRAESKNRASALSCHYTKYLRANIPFLAETPMPLQQAQDTVGEEAHWDVLSSFSAPKKSPKSMLPKKKGQHYFTESHT